MIEVSGLRKTFGAKVAVNDVSFFVPKGQVLGFLGPNGAGKTTTMRILTSFMMPDAGTAKVAGFDVVTQSVESRARIGYLSESAPLYGDMRVLDYLGFIAEIRKIDRAKRSERIEYVVNACGLRPVLMNAISELSRGYRQRTGLAQAIIHDPDVLILDEPTSGLDPNQIVDIRNLIKREGERKTVILSTHIMQEVNAVCGRVLIIADGKIVADGAPDELQRRASGTERVVTRLRGGDPSTVEFELRRLPGVQSVAIKSLGENGQLHCELDVARDKEIGEEIFCLARDKNWILSELRREGVSLESVFARVTAGDTQGVN